MPHRFAGHFFDQSYRWARSQARLSIADAGDIQVAIHCSTKTRDSKPVPFATDVFMAEWRGLAHNFLIQKVARATTGFARRRGVTMKRLTSIVLFTFLVVPRTVDGQALDTNAGPVVVELFTSEGCSSCPVADTYLAELARDPSLVVLAWHVDYWDRLGWRDPFSTKEATERQRRYARAFESGQVYTPQLVIDGREECVGSDREQSSSAIAAAHKARKAPVTISKVEIKDGAVEVSIEIDGLHTPVDGDYFQAVVALTEDGLSSDVTRGENSGRHLEHVAVIRAFKRAQVQTDTGYSGTFEFELDAGWDRSKLKIVAFVQKSRGMEILGAASKGPRPEGDSDGK